MIAQLLNHFMRCRHPLDQRSFPMTHREHKVTVETCLVCGATWTYDTVNMRRGKQITLPPAPTRRPPGRKYQVIAPMPAYEQVDLSVNEGHDDGDGVPVLRIVTDRLRDEQQGRFITR